ncbi:enoyl-CoA hydratase [Shewanella colwelliana]|uniref:Enoyl-CoA hydratase n=1 Tax=Shewanella colwelliana TaxID=23 RepID=A0A1E5IWN8_SHECO|nr:enoyl-CoA hydratase-related protein [Shewanella colwelliana]MDX1282577.1 enoyl-CoA hydratase-related protein [Shewanella colwelliana]OEG74991.1 enoyl-CoA hydratase [Shewanella colwelliana]GIU18082.1 enoyl-CoA hydratase [Shewanella colwelliana]GIU36718.1 enoyl-CoA hydratase [Shewanella colwelliana]
MSTVQIQDEQGVRIITINRPEKRNALSLEMYTQLTEYLIQGESDNGINAFMIKGQNDCFTSGNDVADFLKNSDLGPEHPAFTFLFTLLDLKKPVVAAVTGPAVGIGTTLLLHCDLVYADNKAKFQLPFVNLALVPEAGASLLLPRLMGQQKAAELLLLGESFDAAKAHTLNIINAVVDSENLIEFSLSQAIKLASKPPQALQASRQLMRDDIEVVRAQMQKELKQFAIRLQSDEAKAQFRAFLSK